MTSSTSSSSSAIALLAVLLLAGALPAAAAAPAEPPQAAPSPRRVALFPIDNQAGSAVPYREFRGLIEVALAQAGLEVVSGDAIEQFLLRNRVRNTSGIGADLARSAGEQLGVDAVILTSLERYSESPPELALTMRATAARDHAPLLWIDGVSRTANDAPGLLGLGIVGSMDAMRSKALRDLSRSLSAALAGRGPAASACPGGGRYRPRVRYRSPLLEPGEDYSVAVVPFRNLTTRRSAGDVITLEFLRQFAATSGFHVIEPGVVRDTILENRVVMEGGISLDQVRTLVGAIGADLVVAGDVLEIFDSGAATTVNFTFSVLDGTSGEILWQSTSYARGDDGVWFFGRGMVLSAPALACRMARSAIDEMFRVRPPPGATRRRVAPEVETGPKKGEYRPPERKRQ